MVTHTAHYSKLENPNANFTYNDLIGVDMFPYKVKGRDKFYHRNHPQNLNPDSYKFITYWEDFIKKCVEGLWIKDDNGVWVYMMPKLFYYVNYVRILDKDRRKIHPDLCDLEWIYFSYFMCLDGFSGFEEDDTYTCHRLVERVENSLDKRYTEKEREMFALSPIELTKIPDSCYSKETGKLKKFIDPWEFLTRTYLIDDPRGKLGQPLYENKRKNGLILGARAIRKSFSVFMGDFMHEYTFSGVRKYEDLEHVNDPLLFGMGCGSSVQLQRTLNNIKGFYDSQPGKYKFREPDIPDYMGPMYKNYQGKFEVGGEFQHIIKGKNNIIELFGSTVQMSVIRPDRTKIGAGDRFRRIYIEEIGFLEYIKEVYHANRDSLAIGDETVGSWIGLGCVCKGTKVLNNEGNLVNVEDLSQDEGILGFDLENNLVCEQYIDTLQLPFKTDCYRIITNTGRELEASYNHPIFKKNIKKKRFHKSDKRFITSFGDFEEMKNLSVGDEIAIVDKIDVWGNKPIFDPRLLGLLVGDGSYGKGQNIRMFNKDIDVWNYIESKYEVKYEEINNSLRKGRIKGIIPNIIKEGIRGQTGKNKKIPKSLFYASKEDVCEFLGGYFDSDGCINFNEKTRYYTIKLTSISKSLIQDSSLLLNKLGIHGKIIKEKPSSTNIAKGKHYTYSLYIKDKRSIIAFYKNIKLLVTYKQKNLELCYKAALDKKSLFIDSSPFRFEKIKSIEHLGIKDVYNLNAWGTHTYMANNILTHNTGGDMEAIKGPKEMFDNPDGFDIMGVPNYWRKNNKKVALFISCLYQKRKYEDENGFVFLDEAIREVDRDRQKWMETLDSVSYTSRINYNPIIPDEMLVPNERSILPKKEAQYRLNEIKDSQLLKFLTNIGELVYDTSYPHGVRFDKDTKKKLKPILDYNVDFQKIDTSGAFVMYEPPPSGKIPKFMYWVVYDPAAQSGEGTSLHSVIVYKHFLSKDGKNMSDTIVAEWVGRKMTLDQNYDMVIRIAKYYNAKIFPETNIAGFVEWCKTNNHLSMLQRDSYELEQEISPGSKRSYYKAGFQMTGRKKWWAMQRFSDWLLEVRSFDPESGVPDKRNIDFIFSTRILDEVVYFNDVDNFDHLSSCFGLMLLLNQLDTQYPKDLDEDPEDDPWGPDPIQPIVLTRRRSLLESF